MKPEYYESEKTLLYSKFDDSNEIIFQLKKNNIWDLPAECSWGPCQQSEFKKNTETRCPDNQIQNCINKVQYTSENGTISVGRGDITSTNNCIQSSNPSNNQTNPTNPTNLTNPTNPSNLNNPTNTNNDKSFINKLKDSPNLIYYGIGVVVFIIIIIILIIVLSGGDDSSSNNVSASVNVENKINE